MATWEHETDTKPVHSPYAKANKGNGKDLPDNLYLLIPIFNICHDQLFEKKKT